VSTTYEVSGAVLRFAKRVEQEWTDEQKGVMVRAKSVHAVTKTVLPTRVFSQVTGLLIAEIPGATYELVACIMRPDLIRSENDPDLEQFKAYHGEGLKVIQS
jgi:hypothetical protein